MMSETSSRHGSEGQEAMVWDGVMNGKGARFGGRVNGFEAKRNMGGVDER